MYTPFSWVVMPAVPPSQRSVQKAKKAAGEFKA
jgi:hypothetical protein